MSESSTPDGNTAAKLIAEQRYQDAVKLLQERIAGNPTFEDHSQLALAFLQLEDYESAAGQYESAARLDPANTNVQEMLRIAKANAVAEINIRVPDPVFFEREKLLAAPEVEPGVLPGPIPPYSKSIVYRLRTVLGAILGFFATHGVGLATRVLGRVIGYRGNVWTNWYRRPRLIGVLLLAYMREKLNRDNLLSSYPPGSLIGFQPGGGTPPPGVKHFRTADGSWNNLSDPKEGAAGTRFLRNVHNDAISAEMGGQLMEPNPRLISRKLLARDGEMKEVPFLNMLAASWINFQNHDWVHHGENLAEDTHAIPLDMDDPARSMFGQTEIRVGKTQPDPTRQTTGETTPLTFVNEVTHWWDGSQIYGSDQATIDRLRTGTDGKMRVTENGTLPLDEKGIEQTGFTRNWWVGLTMLHTLFTREHNAICDELKRARPDRDDNTYFNLARLINAAVMAKIHSVEWTPAILPNRGLVSGLNANWYGLLTNVLRKGKDRKTFADINIRNPELGGVVGNPINKHGQPYGLTEEFVEVYRLHSLLPETINVKQVGKDEIAEKVPFVATRQAGSGKLLSRFEMADLFYTFGVQHPGQLVLNNYPNFMREFSIPGTPLFDMAAVDILRARERGVPRYNEFRRQLNLNPIHSFEDLTDDAEQVEKLKEVYGRGPEAVEKLDLLVGTLGETQRPTNFGFGETLFQIFILNASRRLQADRFYTDDYNEDVYTREGLSWIDAASLKTVLLRHYPELGNTGLVNVKNAFEPWDTGEKLEEARHPLRKWDTDLKPDPWVGDSFRNGT